MVMFVMLFVFEMFLVLFALLTLVIGATAVIAVITMLHAPVGAGGTAR